MRLHVKLGRVVKLTGRGDLSCSDGNWLLAVSSSNVNKAWFWGYRPATTKALRQEKDIYEVIKKRRHGA